MTRVNDVGPAPTPGDPCYQCQDQPVSTHTPGPGLCLECLDDASHAAELARWHAAQAADDITMSRRNKWAAL